jgi:YesN/AraC family two-component response regulator
LLANFLDVTKIEFCTQVKDAKGRELFERISSLVIGRVDFSDSFRFEIRTALLDFLLHLYKHHVISYNKEELESVASLHCKKAIRYITKNYSEEISIDAIAKSCMINKAHLSRIFKKETGKTLIEFLNIIRCTRAKELISEGFSVEEAATKCAFNNISYFTRTYKKHIGALPSKTKKRLKNKSINNT